jgi:hypothetical protein
VADDLLDSLREARRLIDTGAGGAELAEVAGKLEELQEAQHHLYQRRGGG